jgi:spore maturation protein CgeB
VKVVYFTHSLVSDWNHGNAHFLRGVVTELQARGHDVDVWEPQDGWSRAHLDGRAVRDFHAAFPHLRSRLYGRRRDLARVVDGADVVIVHEWNEPELVGRLGRLRGDFTLLFHDTHHRAATAPGQLARYDLSAYDGVLAFGAAIAERYDRAWIWHEAADTRVFRPRAGVEPDADLIWVGNWGDDERTDELHEFLLEPARELGLTGSVYGVRYPREAVRAVERAGLAYRGWVANHRVPELFARHRVTVHVPRRPYRELLPGIPTIRPFEALACGIPLVTAPWDDVEGLFTPGADYLVARDGAHMVAQLTAALEHPRTAAHGLATIRARHTCAHRVDELLALLHEVDERSEQAA